MIVTAPHFKLMWRDLFRNGSWSGLLTAKGEFPMANSSATISTKTLIVILSLAAMPAVSFAQSAGGAAGSSGGSAGSTGGVANSPAPAPGTNSLGTAQSSGGGTTGTGTGGSGDAAVNAENRMLDKKLKSICRGC
jgi:hypothetical protein